MKDSTYYLIGAIAFLLVSAYMILSGVTEWHGVVAVSLTFVGGVMYTVLGIREKLKERAADMAPSTPTERN